jgi:hypothetical protein
MTARADRESFVAEERRRQVVHFDDTHPGRARFLDSAYRFVPEQKTSNLASINLAPSIREVASRYFDAYNITWHTHAHHALSSQICCLNFLMPMADDRDRVQQLVSTALSIEKPEMLEAENGPDGRPWFIGFEWNGGGRDYLNESRKGEVLKRGSNSTSADAMVRFRSAGKTEILLIEWKYTEKYGAPIPARGNDTRVKRYKNLAFAPDGPIRAEQGLALADFFYEPFYQLLRQQMLAFQLEKTGGADRARVLHISPSRNHPLHHVTSPGLRRFGDDAFNVFKQLLVDRSQFVSRSAEDLFRPLITTSAHDDPWASYLVQRYGFLDARNA